MLDIKIKTKKIFNELYIGNLLNEYLWFDKGNALWNEAQVFVKKIEKDYEASNNESTSYHFDDTSQSVFFLLVSYAVENFLKGIIILKNKTKFKTDVTNNQSLPSDLKSHNLLKLLFEAELSQLVPEKSFEKKLLEKMSESAVWYGRYPVPIKPRELEQSRGILYSDLDMKVAEQLIKKIKNEIKTQTIKSS